MDVIVEEMGGGGGPKQDMKKGDIIRLQNYTKKVPARLVIGNWRPRWEV